MALIAMTVSAQNKLDNAARMAIGSSTDSTQTFGVIVEFKGDNVDFGDYKIDELSRIGNMAIVSATAAQIEEIAELPQVLRISLGGEARPLDSVKSAAEPAVEQPGSDGSESWIKRFWRKIKSWF